MHRARQLVLRRLVAPLMRGQHPPEYTARGTAVGLVIAFTPTVGVQMPAVFLLWALARYLRPAWNFNLVVAIAWTWLTNVFTMAIADEDLGLIHYVETAEQAWDFIRRSHDIGL